MHGIVDPGLCGSRQPFDAAVFMHDTAASERRTAVGSELASQRSNTTVAAHGVARAHAMVAIML